MITQVYAIFDSVANMYNKPFHQVNEAVALRTCKDLANDPNSEIAKNPDNYSLFHLGEYDDATAEFKLKACPQIKLKFHEIAGN